MKAFKKLYDYWPSKGWVQVTTKDQATEKQLRYLKWLGWKYTDYTKNGAWYLIEELLKL